jgi:predicted ATPase
VGVALAEADEPIAQVGRALRDRALLLVVDGMEPLVDGAPVLWQLVRQAPGVKLVVTSRVRLRLLGAWEGEVRGLPLPDGPDDLAWAGASVLFLQQASQARAGRPLDGPDGLSVASRAAVVRLCQLVGGLPLALVLAAAWTPVLSCTEIATALAAGADVGAAGVNVGAAGADAPVRGLPERQRRVCDILDAAWAALPPPEQAVLRWLPLFHGGFTREAARVVVGASPQHLLTLLDHLLLSGEGGARYTVPEAVSRYVRQQQAGRPEEHARMVARHAAYYADYVQARGAALRHVRQAVAELEAERANIQAAWEWAAAAGQVNLLDRLRPALRLFAHPAAGATHPPPRVAAVAAAPVALGWSSLLPGGPGAEHLGWGVALAAS